MIAGSLDSLPESTQSFGDLVRGMPADFDGSQKMAVELSDGRVLYGLAYQRFAHSIQVGAHVRRLAVNGMSLGRIMVRDEAGERYLSREECKSYRQ